MTETLLISLGLSIASFFAGRNWEKASAVRFLRKYMYTILNEKRIDQRINVSMFASCVFILSAYYNDEKDERVLEKMAGDLKNKRMNKREMQ